MLIEKLYPKVDSFYFLNGKARNSPIPEGLEVILGFNRSNYSDGSILLNIDLNLLHGKKKIIGLKDSITIDREDYDDMVPFNHAYDIKSKISSRKNYLQTILTSKIYQEGNSLKFNLYRVFGFYYNNINNNVIFNRVEPSEYMEDENLQTLENAILFYRSLFEGFSAGSPQFHIDDYTLSRGKKFLEFLDKIKLQAPDNTYANFSDYVKENLMDMEVFTRTRDII